MRLCGPVAQWRRSQRESEREGQRRAAGKSVFVCVLATESEERIPSESGNRRGHWCVLYGCRSVMMCQKCLAETEERYTSTALIKELFGFLVLIQLMTYNNSHFVQTSPR